MLSTPLGRVLDVDEAQRAPIGSQSGPFAERLSDRSRWGSLGDVAASTRLITQRSLVQIQPPQPFEEQARRGVSRDHGLTPFVSLCMYCARTRCSFVAERPRPPAWRQTESLSPRPAGARRTRLYAP